MARAHPQSEKTYGYVGWKEFLRTRQDLLNKFDSAKGFTVSRPVRTDHGPAAEALIRKWLTDFLPSKYGVSSGYMIPGLIGDKYTLYHYDVIVYDQINSPVLWIEDNLDHSEQGRRRAIPAEHVRGIFEVKSRFTTREIKDSVKKLGELRHMLPYLGKVFISGIIFYELEERLINRSSMLKHLVPDTPIPGYSIGLVLRCGINPAMTGLISLNQLETDPNPHGSVLAKDVNEVEVWSKKDGSGYVIGPGAAAEVFCEGNASLPLRERVHVNKVYGCSTNGSDGGCVLLSWSYNNFAKFVIELLLLLDGKDWRKYEGVSFGQVFNRLSPKPHR